MPTLDFEAPDGAHYALHLQCPWQLVDPAGLITGNMDVYEPPFDRGPTFDFESWEREDRADRFGTRYGYNVLKFLEAADPAQRRVARAAVDALGNAEIALAGGAQLRVLIGGSAPSREMWRFFAVDSPDPHFVVTGARVDS